MELLLASRKNKMIPQIMRVNLLQLHTSTIVCFVSHAPLDVFTPELMLLRSDFYIERDNTHHQ